MRSSLEYADVVWDGCSESDSNLLVSLQIEGATVVTGALKGTNRVSLLKDLSWVELSVRRKFHKFTLMYKMVFNPFAPEPPVQILVPSTACDVISFNVQGQLCPVMWAEWRDLLNHTRMSTIQSRTPEKKAKKQPLQGSKIETRQNADCFKK